MSEFLGRRQVRLIIAAIAVLLVAVVMTLWDFPRDYPRAQTSRAAELVELLCDQTSEGLACPDAEPVRDATRDDHRLVVIYLLLGAVAVRSLAGMRTWSEKAGSGGTSDWAALGLLLAGALSDVVENELLRGSATRLLERPFFSPAGGVRALGALPDRTVLFATCKWAFLAAAAAVVLWTLFGPPRATADAHPVDTRPTDQPAPGWDPPPDTEERLGICCSGGGIRSAAFSLGALQALRSRPRGDPLLARAAYLSAVSGGGYLAAGLAVAESTVKVAPGEPPVFAPGSEEERHFRNHSSYLIPDVKKGAVGVGRLLLGLVLNLALVWLVLFAIARPIGWLIGEVHPELRANGPVALTRDPVPALRVKSVERVACTPGSPCETPEGSRTATVLYEVDLEDETGSLGTSRKDEQTPEVLLDVAPFSNSDAMADCSFLVTDTRSTPRDTVQQDKRSRPDDDLATARRGLVAVTGSKAEVVRQPIVEVLTPRSPTEPCLELSRTLEIERQPELSLRSPAVGTARMDLQGELRVSTQARVTSATGLRGRDDVTVQGWMWGAVLGASGAALFLTFLLVALRPSGRFGWTKGRWPDPDPRRKSILHRLGDRRTMLLWAAVTATVAALASFVVLVAMPWLVQELPMWLVSASGTLGNAAGATGSGLHDYLLPGGGALFLGVTAFRRYLSGAPDTDDGRTKVDSPGLPKRMWRWLSGRSKELNWYELSPAKVLLGLLLVAAFIVIFVLHLQYASANGPGGRLMGMAFIRDHIGYGWWLPEWKRYALLLAGLVAFQRLVDAHAWSLQPFYKRRLSSAYLEGRRQDAGYDDRMLCFQDLEPSPGFPQLVVGCAVNLSEVGRVPPARRAASFTFSASEIGGPLVGYMSTAEYWKRVRRSRQKDITVPGAMAISGAAFSPAMGKKNLGPVGAIMAMANLRLGVWLPHPQYVDGTAERSWIHRPGWSYFMRELCNSYRFDRPYLYVSDGGHWENLGLVELLRRGCTEVICINAGGDSQRAFGTIGEAIALAREELGVEFYDFDASPLRPPLKADEKGRLLRREIARDKPEPLATASYVCGRFRYPPKDGARREGRIWLVEPALTADLPFDVHVFAESEAIFPDDSTADQVFNHRQFEAFRALGYHQVSKVASAGVLKG